MIPFTEHNNNNKELECHFIHANGFPPSAYDTFLSLISSNFKVKSPLLRPHWENHEKVDSFENWDLFLNDFIEYCDENNINNSCGIGHSIGGNILIRACLQNNNLFKSIILLDPTIFIPSIVRIWKMLSSIPFIKSSFPLAKAARNRRTSFDDYNHVFESYRNKKIFSKIPDKQLSEYIKSIFSYNETNKTYALNYKKEWEEKMYLTSLFKDIEVWKNIHKLNIPTLILTPDTNPVLRKSAINKFNSNQNIKFITIKNSSHLFPLEKPKEVSEIISDFLKI